MLTYIGTKILKARPLNRRDYNKERGWTMPADENGDDTGYLVEYEDGYISWTPTKQFEEAYQNVRGAMSFNHAIEFLKAGKKIARSGWNGKGMYLQLVEGINERFLHYIQMKTAQDQFVPWLASQTDILSDDWDAFD